MTTSTSNEPRQLSRLARVARAASAVLVAGALVMGAAAPQASAQGTPPNFGHWDYCGDPARGEQNRPGVYLYEHPNYEGKCSRLTFSVPNLEFSAFVGGLASSMRVVVPFGATMGLTLYPGPFYGPEPNPDYVTGAFPGATTPGFVRIYGFRDFNRLPVIVGGVETFKDISDDIKSVGIAMGTTAADFSQPVFGPECPPVGRYCWVSSLSPRVWGSRGAVYVPNANAFTGPVDLCSIWKVGCGPNPTGTEQIPLQGGGGGTPPATGADGRLIPGRVSPGDRINVNLTFIPWSQSLSR